MSNAVRSYVKVRIGNLDDAVVIANFTRRIALETEDIHLDPNTVLQGVENGLGDEKNGFYIVAEKDGQVIGCLMITYEWSDWRNGVQWWLQSVYVDTAHRGSGVFNNLFNFVLECANRENNVCGIRLYVDKSNSVAQSIYESLGMMPTNYLLYEMSLLD